MSGLELKVTLDPSKIDRFQNMLGALGDEKRRLAMCRALNHEGAKAKTQVVRALAAQTGLQRQVIVRAVHGKQAWGSNLSYVMESGGGEIRLKFFKARKTKAGVSAYPWGKLASFPGYWIRGGFNGVRKDLGGAVR